nr:NAC domain-containing protein 48-like [Setaria viridis]
MMAGGFLTKHGFPCGYRFVPTNLELFSLLSDKIDGAKLRPPHNSIFHDVPILDYHPEELCEKFRKDAEHRCIYFFSRRVFKKQGTGGGAITPEGKKEPRPVRAARGGTWKASGGGKLLCWPRNKGGFVAGRVVTMVFYDHGVDKSNWGMHEFTVPVDKRLRLSSLPTNFSKYIRFEDLALYRIYILRSGDMEIENAAGSSSLQMLANANDHFSALSTAVAPCLPIQPSWGVFAAGASTTSQTPQQQHPGVDHSHYYHHQPAFGAASAGAAAQQQAHNVSVHGAGLPGYSCQFASPPAPAPMPPAAANPAAHQAPATAAQAHGTRQEAGHFGATHSPCPPPAEQHATATTEPAHAQFADCFKPVEEAAPPQLEDIVLTAEDDRMGMADADEYLGAGIPDWDLGFAPFDRRAQLALHDGGDPGVGGPGVRRTAGDGRR